MSIAQQNEIEAIKRRVALLEDIVSRLMVAADKVPVVEGSREYDPAFDQRKTLTLPANRKNAKAN